MRDEISRARRRLAERNGVQLSYLDSAGKRRIASPEILSAVLKALAVPASSKKEIDDSLRDTELRPYRQGVEPVVVAWQQRSVKVRLYLPKKLAGKPMRTRLYLEDGRPQNLPSARRVLKARRIEGEEFIGHEFSVPPLPFGYHDLEFAAGGAAYRTLMVSAPIHSFAKPGMAEGWGAFLPMYALHSEQSWGAGNFSDWERFAEWVGSLGGHVAATLPLLAAFLDHPVCEPSPYSPASRLFWNEFYLDITRVPEFAHCRSAQLLVDSAPFQKKLHAFRASEFIDYRAQWLVRRRVLSFLCKEFFSASSARRMEFERFLRQRPEVQDYAAFRAACDKSKISWHRWPARMRNGLLRLGDYDQSAKQFHLYTQWLAHEQMQQLAASGEQAGVKLYLDLPLGVNPDGYDVWSERDSFALGANAGAPPDMFFSKGQDWGFAPLHPRGIRGTGYRHLRALLRFQMRHAGLLRIDHVMGLHRLYWVPRGFEASQGTYVNYPAEELHAIFNLESHRNRTVLVGENLGTVPPIVNRSLRRHRIREMFVVQFEGRPDPHAALRRPPALSVASVNTHDTPTFAAHWRGDDLRDCARLGLLSRSELGPALRKRNRLGAALVKFLKSKGLLENRQPQVRDVLRALLQWLNASESELVLVNVEDLWLETRPQNVPGTSGERPNWRRKTRYTLEEIFRNPEFRELVSL